jgi:hypothetical protein
LLLAYCKQKNTQRFYVVLKQIGETIQQHTAILTLYSHFGAKAPYDNDDEHRVIKIM